MTAFFCLFQTIGQAFEDMQTQNQHLLQQVAERDDLNIKVFLIPSGSFFFFFF